MVVKSIFSQQVGTHFPDVQLASIQDTFHLSEYREHQNLVLHFVCHFSCSRCWRSMLQLRQLYPSLSMFNTTVLVVGTGQHLCPATRLAHELALPFPLLTAVPDTFPLLPVGDCQAIDPHYSATVLLDTHGIIRHAQYAQVPRAALDVPALRQAVAYLCARQGWQKRVNARSPVAVKGRTQGQHVCRLPLPVPR